MEFTLPFSPNKYEDRAHSVNCFVKVLNEQYLEEFLNGNIYMNPFGTFKDIEDQNIRGDILEGIDSSCNGSQSKTTWPAISASNWPKLNANEINLKYHLMLICSGVFIMRVHTLQA